MRRENVQKYSGFTFISTAGICFSTLSILSVKLNELGIGTWDQILVRMGCASLVFTLVSARLHSEKPKTIRHWLLGINGVLMFAGSVTYLAALELGTAPTKAILLAFMFPIYTVVLGALFFQEAMTQRKLVAVGLGMVGLAFTLEIRSFETLNTFSWGDVFAFANGFVAAAIIMVGRHTGRSQQSPMWVLSRTYSVALLSLLVLGAGYALAKDFTHAYDAIVFTPTTNGILYLIGLAVFSTIVPFGLLYTGLQVVPSSIAGILMLFEPVSVFVLAALFLDSPITFWQIAGGAAILFASSLVVTSSPTNERPYVGSSLAGS